MILLDRSFLIHTYIHLFGNAKKRSNHSSCIHTAGLHCCFFSLVNISLLFSVCFCTQIGFSIQGSYTLFFPVETEEEWQCQIPCMGCFRDRIGERNQGVALIKVLLFCTFVVVCLQWIPNIHFHLVVHKTPDVNFYNVPVLTPLKL